MMKRTLTSMALAGALALGACTTVDPETGERRLTHAGEGAIAGGVIGGIIGAIARPHHAGRGALIGAGLGALTGAAIGSYQDRHEAMMRHRMRRHAGVVVERRGQRIVLSLRNDILFAPGSAELEPGARRAIRDVAWVLRRNPQNTVHVYGFTDTVGGADENMELSQARADAVAAVLEEYGVDQARVETRGFGETHPRVRTGDDVDEPANRRVEVVLEPITG
jgi:outer membrane protein OmpA-like peptidoglycan-associated protein